MNIHIFANLIPLIFTLRIPRKLTSDPVTSSHNLGRAKLEKWSFLQPTKISQEDNVNQLIPHPFFNESAVNGQKGVMGLANPFFTDWYYK